MSIEQLISYSVPTLSPSDTVSNALDTIDDSRYAGLPVITEDDYTGMAMEVTLQECEDATNLLSDTNILQFRPAISSHAHPFDALNIMHETKLSLLPVTDDDHKYIGCITQESLLSYFATHSAINNPGGVLVLEVLPINYSMCEIARICENEEVAILGMQLRTNGEGKLEVTLKLNRTVLDAVVSSFERHNYQVLEVYGKENNVADILDKYNLLMNYINM